MAMIGLTRLKYAPPKKPVCADSGLGCVPVRIKWCFAVISFSFVFALAPQSMKTMGFSLSLSLRIITSVKVSHPLPLWEFGMLSLTVSTVLRSSTPCDAQEERHP